MLEKAAAYSAPKQQERSVQTTDTRPAWRDDRIPLLASVPNFIPGTHPVEDEEDIVAVVDTAMAENVRTPQELREWLDRQQMLMVRSGMLGRDWQSPTMAERAVKTLARYLAVRASIHAQMDRKAEPNF